MTMPTVVNHSIWKTSLILIEIMLSLWPGTEAGIGLYMGPYFAEPESRNITVHQGSVAYLPCVVKQLGDKSVSWVRQRDADILTVDKYTFVRDERFTVYLSTETDTWTLVIKSVQARDGGAYECQISTEPKMALVVNLHVLVPSVEILGEREKFVRVGSSTRLECRVQSGVQLPDYIFWYHHGERLLEYDNHRLSISVTRQGGDKGEIMSLVSILVIKRTRAEDKGNYSCLPSNLDSAGAILHVLNGEHPAAMQTGSGMIALTASTLHLIIAAFLSSLFLPVLLFKLPDINYRQNLSLCPKLLTDKDEFVQNNICRHSKSISRIRRDGRSLFCRPNFPDKNLLISNSEPLYNWIRKSLFTIASKHSN